MLISQSAARRGSQRDLAHDIGITPQYLSDILKHRRPISAKVAAMFGYEMVFRKVKNNQPKENPVA